MESDGISRLVHRHDSLAHCSARRIIRRFAQGKLSAAGVAMLKMRDALDDTWGCGGNNSSLTKTVQPLQRLRK